MSVPEEPYLIQRGEDITQHFAIIHT